MWVAFAHLSGSGFGFMSPASKSRMKRWKGGRAAGGIDIEDLMIKCRQKVGVGGFEGAETDNIRTLNA